VTLYGVGTQQCAQFIANDWASGAGGLTITDNGTIPSSFLIEPRLSTYIANNLTSLQTSIRTITASGTTTLAANDSVVLADATLGNITLSLPNPNTITGSQAYFIKKTDASANTVTINAGANTLDGVTTKVLWDQYQACTIRSDGTNWFVTGADGISLSRFTVPAFSPLLWGQNTQNYIQIDGTPKMVWSLGGSTQMTLGAGTFGPASAGAFNLGTAAVPFGNVFTSKRTTYGAAALVWATTIAVDASLGSFYVCTATSNIAATLSNPTNQASAGQAQAITIEFLNSSGGALTTPIAFGANYKNTGTVSPANGTARLVTFWYDQVRNLWLEVARTAADI